MRAARPSRLAGLARPLVVAMLAAAVIGVPAIASAQKVDVVRIEDRFSALERQNAALTGQVEQLQYKIQQLQSQIERMQTDYDFRLSQLEGKAGGARPSAPAAPAPQVRTPPPAPAAPPAASMGSSPGGGAPSGGGVLTPPSGGGGQVAAAPPGGQNAEQLYEAGFNQMQERDYTGAEQTFRSFLQAYPRHPLAGNAQFWIGEIFFARKDYVNASIAYAEGYRSYKNSPKGADNLLQLGRSLALTNQVKDACTIWDRLGREYPNAGELIRMRTAQERQRYHCS